MFFVRIDRVLNILFCVYTVFLCVMKENRVFLYTVYKNG